MAVGIKNNTVQLKLAFNHRAEAMHRDMDINPGDRQVFSASSANAGHKCHLWKNVNPKCAGNITGNPVFNLH